MNDQYCLFANKPTSSFNGRWGANVDYDGYNITETHLLRSELMYNLATIARMEAELRQDEDGFLSIIVMASVEPPLDETPSPAVYRVLSADELQELLDPLKAQAVIDVAAEKAAAAIAGAARIDADARRTKMLHYERLKAELNL